MNFKILWDPKAVSQLRKFPKDISSRIVKGFCHSGIFIELESDRELMSARGFCCFENCCEVFRLVGAEVKPWVQIHCAALRAHRERRRAAVPYAARI